MINVIIIIYNNYDLRKKKAADELIITLSTLSTPVTVVSTSDSNIIAVMGLISNSDGIACWSQIIE